MEAFEIPKILVGLEIIVEKENISEQTIRYEAQKQGLKIIDVVEPQLSNCIKFKITKKEYVPSWSVDECIQNMFCNIDELYQKILYIANNVMCRIRLDIAIDYHETLPAIEISRENIRKLSELGAEISIDIF